jgi:MFS family permease
MSMVKPFLAMHLAVDRKLPAVVVGMIWTIAGAVGAATQWVAGELADRMGRRPLMVASMLVRSAMLLGMGFAIATDASVFTIGLLVVANSMLRAFFDPIANAMVADLCPVGHRVGAFGLQRVGINIGWAAGTAIPALAAGRSYAELFYWSVPVTLIATIGVALTHEPPAATRARPPSLRELFAFRDDRAFVRFLIATVAFFILQAQLYQSLSIYAARVLHLSRGQVSTLYTLNGVLVIFLQLPAVAAIHRIGTSGALVVGCLGYALSYASVGLSVGQASILACVACVTLAEIVTAPAQQATVTTLAPVGRVGSYSGLYGLCQMIGQTVLGPIIGTATLDAVPPRAAWFLIALFGVAAALGYRASRSGAGGERLSIMRASARADTTEKE